MTRPLQRVFNNISVCLERCQRSGGETSSCAPLHRPPSSHSPHSLSPLNVLLNYTQTARAFKWSLAECTPVPSSSVFLMSSLFSSPSVFQSSYLDWAGLVSPPCPAAGSPVLRTWWGGRGHPRTRPTCTHLSLLWDSPLLQVWRLLSKLQYLF